MQRLLSLGRQLLLTACDQSSHSMRTRG